MLSNRANSLKPICKIDVTAFASVMVFLVALMMFVRPSTHHGVGVDLPRVNHPVNMRDANREYAVLVAIMNDGKVFFGDEHVTAEQLTDKIGSDSASTPSARSSSGPMLAPGTAP
jgi:biopolymer transport protein ExbD